MTVTNYLTRAIATKRGFSMCAALALIASVAIVAASLATAGMAGETMAQQQQQQQQNNQGSSVTLLFVAERARDHVKEHLESDSPDVVYELFARGLLYVDHLKVAAKSDDADSAGEYFLAAMTSFKGLSEKMHEHERQEVSANGTIPAGSQSAVITTTTHPEDDLARLHLYADTLKVISESMDAPVDFAPLDALFDQARHLVSQGLLHTAGDLIPEIKDNIVRIDSDLRAHSSEILLKHAKEYAMMHIDRVDSILEQADVLQIPPDVVSDLEDARHNLAAAETSEQIRERVKDIMLILER